MHNKTGNLAIAEDKRVAYYTTADATTFTLPEYVEVAYVSSTASCNLEIPHVQECKGQSLTIRKSNVAVAGAITIKTQDASAVTINTTTSDNLHHLYSNGYEWLILKVST